LLRLARIAAAILATFRKSDLGIIMDKKKIEAFRKGWKPGATSCVRWLSAISRTVAPPTMSYAGRR